MNRYIRKRPDNPLISNAHAVGQKLQNKKARKKPSLSPDGKIPRKHAESVIVRKKIDLSDHAKLVSKKSRDSALPQTEGSFL